MTPLFLVLNPTAIQIGDFGIQWYAVLIGIGALLGYFLFSAEAGRLGIGEDDRLDLVFWAMMLGFLGARIYYVVFKLDYYLQNPIEILNIRGGGMAIYGGVIGGALAILYLARQRKISILTIFDAAAPGLLLAQAVGRWGNFMNQEAHGGPVPRAFLENLQLPHWIIEQMNIDGIYYQPTFFYESVWNSIGVIVMVVLRRRVKSLRKGGIMATYLIWYGLGRSWIEGMRTDSLYLGPLRVSQWLSIILIAVGLVYLNYSYRTSLDKIGPYSAK